MALFGIAAYRFLAISQSEYLHHSLTPSLTPSLFYSIISIPISNMSKVLRSIDPNANAGIATVPRTPEKSPSLRKQYKNQGNKSAKKYRAADLLDIALKHERSGDKQRALSAYEDAAENIANNSKIVAKIELLKAQIAEEYERIAMEKKQAIMLQKEAEKRQKEEEIIRTQEIDEGDYYDTDGDVSMMTEDNEDDVDDDLTEAGTLYSEYDPVKREAILKQLQTKTQSALEYQLLDRLNKGEKDELIQLKKIGNVRADAILELRDQYLGEEASGDGAYFKSLDQLEDINMKPKEIKSFLKQNAVFLLGL
jgi:DNA uptake protein ComE-like DNA-binding protein